MRPSPATSAAERVFVWTAAPQAARVVASIALAFAFFSPAAATAAPLRRASAESIEKPKRTARTESSTVGRGRSGATAASKGACLKAPVIVVSGADDAQFSLATCDGKPAPLAVEQLSLLARPGNVAKPRQIAEKLAHARGGDIAPGIKRIDAGLVARLQLVVDHFAKQSETTRIRIVSGYRPASTGSYHQRGRALDFRVDGVANEALVAFCKTLDDTGCGYYPNSVFVHMDVRDRGAGHVEWIDASGPGESPRYVPSWPPPPAGEGEGAAPEGAEGVERTLEKLDSGLSVLPVDSHP